MPVNGELESFKMANEQLFPILLTESRYATSNCADSD